MEQPLPSQKRRRPPVHKPADYDSFIHELNSALASGAVRPAVTLLLSAKAEWAQASNNAAAEVSPARGIPEVTGMLLRSPIGPAVMAGCSPKVRRGGRGVSTMARQAWRNVQQAYARELKYPWMVVSTTADELANWVRETVSRGRRTDAPQPDASVAGRPSRRRTVQSSVPAKLIQQLFVVLMGERNDEYVAEGVVALAEAAAGASHNVQPIMIWAASQLARSNASANHLRLCLALSAPARRAGQTAKQEAKKYETLYETTAADARHFKSRAQDLSRDLEKAIDERQSAEATVAEARKQLEEANATLETMKQQSDHNLRIEQGRLKAEIGRTIGHEVTEALLSLDGEDRNVEMALDRLRRAKRSLAEITRGE